MSEQTWGETTPASAFRRATDQDCGELVAEAIEAIGFGIMLLAEDGFIIFANSMARDLMRRGDGLRSSAGWLAATSAETTARLRALLKAGGREARGVATVGATLVIERREGRQPLLAHVMQLARDGGKDVQAAAAIFIIDPEAYALPSFEAFVASYGLTRAETRVLQQIISGKGLVAAAENLQIGQATARTHMQRIFDKTGTKRQTELLCRFFKATLPGQIASAGARVM
jgi:DNA-binding CsgD family transcriptional regulator